MNIYFIGIGGIGMSALARYFKHEGYGVAGYDRTPSPLTDRLETEGIAVHFADDIESIPTEFRNPATTRIIYTPAIAADHSELTFFRTNGFEVIKRAAILGILSHDKWTMAVAGTHGKTSTTTMVAWFNTVGAGEGSAFLGGISKNFGSNMVLGTGDRLAVEADEFDRSFLQLNPQAAVITSADPDHLDIYGTPEEFKRAFAQFASQVTETLILKKGVDIPIQGSSSSKALRSEENSSDPTPKKVSAKVLTYSLDDPTPEEISATVDGHGRRDRNSSDPTPKKVSATILTYSLDDPAPEEISATVDGHGPGDRNSSDPTPKKVSATILTYSLDDPTTDFYAKNITLQNGGYYNFDIVLPGRVISNCTLGVPGLINVENCIAAVALVSQRGFDEELLKKAIKDFTGVARRFDFWVNKPTKVYMDDYAHHPAELRAMITSVRKMFPDRHLTVIFQPHLYTRTRDFAQGFSDILSLADRTILLPIYPARELPIPGITSQIVLAPMTCEKLLVGTTELAQLLREINSDVVVSAGAGDIDRLCSEIAQIIETK